MSEDVDREKVLRTAKVRTSLKSDLSWIHKEKIRGAEHKEESTETGEEAKLPPQRQLSYVLMTTKKFEMQTSPEQNGKHSEPASPEPTAAPTGPKSNESAEGITNVHVNGVASTEDNCHVIKVSAVEEIAVNGCSADTEARKVTNLPEQESWLSDTTKEEPVPNVVPDILAESVLKSPPPEENGNGQQAKMTTVLDMLSDSLVEPILNIETKEAEGNPSAESVLKSPPPQENGNGQQAKMTTVLDMLSDSLVEPILNIETKEAEGNPSAESVLKSPPPQENGNGQQVKMTTVLDMLSDSLVEPILNIETKEAEGNPSAEMVADQISHDSTVETLPNGTATTQQTGEETIELPKVPEINTSSGAPQDSVASTESQSTPKEEDSGEGETSSAEISAEPVKVGEMADVPKEQEISAVSSDSPQDNADLQEPQSISTKEDTAESGTTGADINAVENKVESVQACEETVEEPTPSDVSTISSDVPEKTQPTTIVSGIPSAEDAAAQSNVEPVIVEATEETVPELPSSNEDTTTISEDASAQENVSDQVTTEGAPSETKEEVIVDQNVQEVVDLETTCPTQAVVESIAEDVASQPAPDQESVGTIVAETKAPVEESPGTSPTIEAVVEDPKENVEESSIECPIQIPALPEINQDETYKAEPAVVVSSPEGTASEVEEANNVATVEEASGDLAKDAVTVTEAVQAENEVEATPEVPAVVSEALIDIKDALETAPSSEQNKEEAETGKPTEVNTTVKESDEPKDLNEEKEPTDNNSAPVSVEEEETSSLSFIMRDGKEVCSHCDQFIGLIKLTFTYPPMYLHPMCLTCGVCTKVLGDLLTPMFEHKHRIYCSDCYDNVYSLK